MFNVITIKNNAIINLSVSLIFIVIIVKKNDYFSRDYHARRSNNRDCHSKVVENGVNNTETLLMASSDSAGEYDKLDTRCSHHLSGSRDLFSDSDDTFGTSVKLIDDRNILIYGKSKIDIRLKDETLNYIRPIILIHVIKETKVKSGT